MKYRPVYLLYILAALVLLVWSAVGSERKKADRFAEELAVSEQLAKEVSDLKGRWQDRKRAQSRLDALTGGAKFKEKLKSRKETKGGVRLEFEGLGPAELDQVVKTVVGDTLQVKQLDVRRKSGEEADLVLEVLF